MTGGKGKRAYHFVDILVRLKYLSLINIEIILYDIFHTANPKYTRY